MDNFFVVNYFDWSVKRISHLDRILRKCLDALRIRAAVRTAYLTDELLTRHTGRSVAPATSGSMTNVEQRMNMYHLVSQTLAYDVEGELVELGCNEGESSVLITQIILNHGSHKRLFVFDSFEGLPSPKAVDGTWLKAGTLSVAENTLIENFDRYNLPLPEIRKGWFADTLPSGLPERICFAYLDGDFYESILVSLNNVYPRMTKGAVCLIDDYCDPSINPRGWNKLPGVKKACDEFLADKPEKVESLYSGAYAHAFFRKK